MVQVLKSSELETDLQRLNDLVRQHGLHYRRVGSTYNFEDFTAHGLKQALGFAEGFDRAKGQTIQQQNEGELRKLATFTATLRKSGLADA